MYDVMRMCVLFRKQLNFLTKHPCCGSTCAPYYKCACAVPLSLAAINTPLFLKTTIIVIMEIRWQRRLRVRRTTMLPRWVTRVPSLGCACALLLLYAAISTPLGCACTLLQLYAAISTPQYYINYVISK